MNNRVNGMLGRNAFDVIRNTPAFPNYSPQSRGADAAMPIIGGGDAGFNAKLSLGDAGALEGRISAAFLGVLVLALVGFNIVTKGIQL